MQNPNYRFFDLKTAGSLVTRLDELTIKLWAKSRSMPDYELLIQKKLRLPLLRYLGKSVCNVPLTLTSQYAEDLVARQPNSLSVPKLYDIASVGWDLHGPNKHSCGQEVDFSVVPIPICACRRSQADVIV